MNAQTIEEILGANGADILSKLEAQAKAQGYSSVRELLIDIAENFSARCSSTADIKKSASL